MKYIILYIIGLLIPINIYAQDISNDYYIESTTTDFISNEYILDEVEYEDINQWDTGKNLKSNPTYLNVVYNSYISKERIDKLETEVEELKEKIDYLIEKIEDEDKR